MLGSRTYFTKPIEQRKLNHSYEKQQVMLPTRVSIIRSHFGEQNSLHSLH